MKSTDCKHGIPPRMCAVCNDKTFERPAFTPMGDDDDTPRIKKTREKQQWVGRGRSVGHAARFEEEANLRRAVLYGGSRYKQSIESDEQAFIEVLKHLPSVAGVLQTLATLRAVEPLKVPAEPLNIEAKPPKNRAPNAPTEPVVRNARAPKPNTRRRY